MYLKGKSILINHNELSPKLIQIQQAKLKQSFEQTIDLIIEQLLEQPKEIPKPTWEKLNQLFDLLRPLDTIRKDMRESIKKLTKKEL